jgi:hypothetical protein
MPGSAHEPGCQSGKPLPFFADITATACHSKCIPAPSLFANIGIII